MNLLNKQHSKVQFTIEKSMQVIQFLYVHVQVEKIKQFKCVEKSMKALQFPDVQYLIKLFSNVWNRLFRYNNYSICFLIKFTINLSPT